MSRNDDRGDRAKSSERDGNADPYRLAVTNQKGGVGKSTLTLNIGGALAHRGNRVLVVDLDPQGYLTSGVGLEELYTADAPNLYTALCDPHGTNVPNVIDAHDEFDVLPANIDMFNLEQELVSMMQGRSRLKQLFDDLTGYDFILVDSPPALGLLTDNALLACENLIIPAEAEDTSIRATEILSMQIETLEEQFGVGISERAVVVSNVDYPLDGEQEEMITWFSEMFAEHIPVFEVRNRAAIKRAWNAGGSIFGHDESCDMEDELERLAKYLEGVRADDAR